MIKSNGVKIVCVECQNSNYLDSSTLLHEFGIENLAEINKLYFKLSCKKCSKKNFEIFLRNKLLFERNNLKICVNCNLPISILRLETLPDSNVCGPNCVEKINKAAKYVSPPPTVPNNKRIGKCGHRMEVRFGTYGWFLGCAKYPTCKNTSQL